MRIFMTGATGYLGGAIARRFLSQGHDVLALVRRADRGRALEEAGAHLLVGDLASPAWVDAAREATAFVHVAAEGGADGVAKDRATVAAFARLLVEAPRPFLYTSGVFVYGDTGGRPVDESAPIDHPFHGVAWRAEHERLVLAAGGIVLRPGIAYGGRGGFVGELIAEGTAHARVSVVGSGQNHWALVHLDDLADAYALVLGRGAPGTVVNVTDGSTLTFGELGRAVARQTGAEVRLVSVDDGRPMFGEYAEAVTMDQVILSPRAQALGWSPRHTDAAGEIDALVAEWRAAG